MISAILFNAGQAILEVFHLNKDGLLGSSFSVDTLERTLLLICTSFCTFHLGALLSLGALNIQSAIQEKQNFFKTLALKRNRFKPYGKQNTDIDHKIFPNQLGSHTQLDTVNGTVMMGWVLTSISFLPAVYVFLMSFKVVLVSGYQGLYQGDHDTSVAAAPAVLAAFVVPATMFLLAGSQSANPVSQKRTRVIALGLMALYIISNTILGQRRNVATRLIAFAWLWHTWIRKIPTSTILIGGLSLTILFPIIAATRNMVGQDQSALITVLSDFMGNKNPVFLTIGEMGISMMTIANIIQLIPSTRPYQMGADYAYALLTLVPNLFWKIHPTIARGLAGNWLTWQIDPEFAARGGGYGFSFIAEAYMNFGGIGGPIALGVLGFFFTLFTVWAVDSRSPAKIAMIGTFIAFFPFYARSESALHVRALVWYAIVPYLGAISLSRWHNRRRKLSRSQAS